MRAKFVFEKFTEDSDPIRDMGIGLRDRLLKKYPWVIPEYKDITRVQDIIRKANGDLEKEVKLATTMSKLITDREKAIRRYLAARKVGGDKWEVSDVFLTRAIELNKI